MLNPLNLIWVIPAEGGMLINENHFIKWIKSLKNFRFFSDLNYKNY